MEALLGNTVVDSKGASFALKDLIKPDTKAVGLYFSAHWCPPCRSFTPMLSKFYTENLKKKGLEIIFISSDKGDAEFKEYLGEMPWYALPYADRERKNKLSAKFKVQGIPSFVILDPSGEVITTEGRRAVMTDNEGTNFPWRPTPVTDTLSTGSFVGKDGQKRTFAELSKDCEAIGLYFSASWCGPCHKFTPILASCYNELAKADADAKRPKRFEVIFMSSDRDEESFKKYFADMPWHALSFEQSELKEALEERYNVEGIPTLILLDPKTGKTLNDEGVQAVASDQTGSNFPWVPKPVELLDQGSAGKIGPSAAVVVFCGTDEKAKELQKDLIPAVQAWRGEAEQGAVCHGDVCLPTGSKLEGTEDVLFFVAGSNPIVDRVKELAHADNVTVAIMDLSGPHYAHSDIASVEKVTPMALRKFVQSYLSGQVTKTPIKAS